jgi:menaquinone-specific isochorismate synthase
LIEFEWSAPGYGIISINRLINTANVEDTALFFRKISYSLVFQERKTKPFKYRTLRNADFPSVNSWTKKIEQIYSLIEQSKISKVVLARQTTFQFSQTPQIGDLLHRLQQKLLRNTLFLIQQDIHEAFLGCTPEILYQRDRQQISTIALAGTRKRGKTIEEDRKLYNELRNCPKERREFDFVRCYLENTLKKICTKVTLSNDPLIVQTATVQHLCQHISAKVHTDHVCDRKIVSILHPTPATGGVPTKYAMRLIQELEEFDRGWYASPIGFFSYDQAKFYVAIRSALLQNNTLHTFAGTGIVSGSTSDREWDELDHKITQFIGLSS